MIWVQNTFIPNPSRQTSVNFWMHHHNSTINRKTVRCLQYCAFFIAQIRFEAYVFQKSAKVIWIAASLLIEIKPFKFELLWSWNSAVVSETSWYLCASLESLFCDVFLVQVPEVERKQTKPNSGKEAAFLKRKVLKKKCSSEHVPINVQKSKLLMNLKYYSTVMEVFLKFLQVLRETLVTKNL